MKLVIFAFLLIAIVGCTTAFNFQEMFNPKCWMPAFVTDPAAGKPIVNGVGGAGVNNTGTIAAPPAGGAAPPSAAKPAAM